MSDPRLSGIRLSDEQIKEIRNSSNYATYTQREFDSERQIADAQLEQAMEWVLGWVGRWLNVLDPPDAYGRILKIKLIEELKAQGILKEEK